MKLDTQDLMKNFQAVANSFLPVGETESNGYLKIHRPPPTFIECRCQWCDELKWPLMYDLDGEQCWFEIPRSCSVTVKESHPDRFQVFRSEPHYKTLLDKKPIVVFSDPIDRFISCINAYLIEGQRYWNYGHQIATTNNVNLFAMTIQERVNWFMDNVDKVTSQQQVHHFQPQVLFVDVKNFSEFTFVWKHDVGKFFGTDEVMNKTDRQIEINNFSDRHLEFLKDYYKDDYAFIEKHGV